MGVSLSKGGNVSLTKEAPGLTAVIVGLGWDVRTTTGTDFDLDASALLVNPAGKVASDANFVFFNNLKSPDGSVEHTGDNITGEGEGDDGAEQCRGPRPGPAPSVVKDGGCAIAAVLQVERGGGNGLLRRTEARARADFDSANAGPTTRSSAS
ncbi:hypothetical protein SALBM311S_00755 [Streptomyces alboniger]